MNPNELFTEDTITKMNIERKLRDYGHFSLSGSERNYLEYKLSDSYGAKLSSMTDADLLDEAVPVLDL